MRVFSQFLRISGAAMVLLMATALFGQSAAIQGQVTDQSGAVIPGATITVTNTATSVSQTTKTDSSGNYRVPALPAGTYDVSIQASGLQKELAKGLILDVGRNTVQNF